MAKNLFSGLVKITGNNWERYDASKNTPGILMFAEISGDETAAHNGKYIVANGIEYKIADATDLDDLIARVDRLDGSVNLLEAWKEDIVDWKAIIDASVNRLETWKTHIDDVSVDALDTSVKNHEVRIKALEDNTAVTDLSIYVHEVVDASIVNLQAKDTEIDSSITDISARLANALTSAEIGAAVDANIATVSLTTTASNGTPSTTSFNVKGDTYVVITSDDASINLTTKIGNVSTATADASGLATAKNVKDYVDAQLTALEQALVFKDSVDEYTDLPADSSAGWTYVATATFEIPASASATGVVEKVENGDLIIANDADKWIVVQRNLDGAVTAAEALTTGKLIIGASGAQDVSTSTIDITDLATAMANANSAVQTVSATSSNAYLDATVSVNASTSTVNVSLNADVIETSTALSGVSATGSFADAKAVKDYVDAAATDVKVQYTLNSSTADYVKTSYNVDDAGRIISSSVGVVVVTLADASNGSTGLADAGDVYEKLTEVEQVIATAQTTMADTLGMDSDFGVTWSTASGIPEGSTYKEAIERIAETTATGVVTSFGGAVGQISVDTTGDATHNVVFTMNSSTLQGNVNLSGIESRIADVSQHAINNDASITDISTRVIPALQAKDAEIDSSIDRLDASVSALETWVANASFVKGVVGESDTLERANDAYVAVSATEENGIVTLDANVQLAIDVSLSEGHQPVTATGLATDKYVKEYVQEALLWEVIG